MNKQRDILHSMFVVVHSLKKGFTNFIDSYDITEMEAKIIFFFDGDVCKISKLIDRFKKHKSTIRQKTRSLEKKGYITIHHSDSDKRERYIKLTKKGKSFYSEIKKIESEYHKTVFNKFTKKEQQELATLLQKLNINNYENIC